MDKNIEAKRVVEKAFGKGAWEILNQSLVHLGGLEKLFEPKPDRLLTDEEISVATIKDQECQARVLRIKRKIEKECRFLYHILSKEWEAIWKEEGIE